MITVEKFYFEWPGDDGHLVLSADTAKDDWAIELLGSEEQPDVSLVVKVRGRENFRRFLQRVHELGMAMLESHPAVAAVDPSVTDTGNPSTRD